MLWLQLYVEGDDLGALILCARAPGAFIEEQLGLLVAAHAAHGDPQPADPGARPGGPGPYRADEGMLMERYQVSGERAFLLSTRISQDSDRKLVEVARSWSSPALLLARTDCHRHRRELFLPAGSGPGVGWPSRSAEWA